MDCEEGLPRTPHSLTFPKPAHGPHWQLQPEYITQGAERKVAKTVTLKLLLDVVQRPIDHLDRHILLGQPVWAPKAQAFAGPLYR